MYTAQKDSLDILLVTKNYLCSSQNFYFSINFVWLCNTPYHLFGYSTPIFK